MSPASAWRAHEIGYVGGRTVRMVRSQRGHIEIFIVVVIFRIRWIVAGGRGRI